MKKTNSSYREKLNHSAAHILAQAVLNLYPDTKLGIGPAIKDGFYYDFQFSQKITEKELKEISREMKKIIAQNLPFHQKLVSPSQALKIFSQQPFKKELIQELSAEGNKKVSLFFTGKNFVDLCRGPHVKTTGEVKAFALLKIAGAYWKGNEKNPMLTRIYGVAFENKKQLKDYLARLEEAKKRDHRLLGKQLEIFTIPQEVGPGLLLWLPNGAIIRREIENLIFEEQTKRGYQQLWVTSGHWDLYRDKMYAPMKIDEEEYLVKPMNCPFHMMVYKSKPRSWRDLPLRIAEIASVYRYEQPGELSGMVRVRYITQDDAHIFCRPEQTVDEFLEVFDYITFLLKVFAIKKYHFRLSLRDPQNKKKYLGNDKIWEEAENKIITALEKKGVSYFKAEGEAAFYGPKLDVIIEDALGREWQCGTIQVDFMLPQRFNLEYTNKKGEKEQPVLIHRAPLGSLERWVGILIEHHGGAFPIWLAPVQVKVLPISEKQLEYAQKITASLREKGIRVQLDGSNQTLSYRIRQGEIQKIPFLVIVGQKEEETETITIRQRNGKNIPGRSLSWFEEKLSRLIKERSPQLLK